MATIIPFATRGSSARSLVGTYVPKPKRKQGLDSIARMAIVRPITSSYLAGVVCVMLAVKGRFGLISILGSLTLFTLVVLSISIQHQIKTMYEVLDEQHERLISRVDELTNTLHEAGVEVPKDKRLTRSRSTIRRG